MTREETFRAMRAIEKTSELKARASDAKRIIDDLTHSLGWALRHETIEDGESGQDHQILCNASRVLSDLETRLESEMNRAMHKLADN